MRSIRRSIGADSLGYVSLAGLVSATEQPTTRLCKACFDGEYPIGLPAGNLIGKHLLEGVGKRAVRPEGAGAGKQEQDYDNTGADRTGSGGKPLVGSPGGGDALHRP